MSDPGPPPEAVEVAIVGAGFSGLGMAIRLEEAGIGDYVILERADDVGGTWRDNTYPGAACDVQSHLYSFSFAPNPGWSSSFSPQPEILAYLRDCAERFDVAPKIRFGHEVTEARWVDAEQRWHVTTGHGVLAARWLVSGMGPLTEPAVPELPGLPSFTGPVWHSARWRHDVDLTGKRVALVGTGASAVQILPELQRVAGQVDVYQRTPPWVVPRMDERFTPRQQGRWRLLPGLQRAARTRIFWQRELVFFTFKSWAQRRNPAEKVARRHLADQVADPSLRARLTPDYAMGCKRILLSDDYYPALAQPNVSLVPSGVTAFTPTGVVDQEGVSRPADVVVFCTGFHATDPPSANVLWGRDGMRLADAWKSGMYAYKGTAVAGYPNLFLLVGPNTGLGHNSLVYIIEAQIDYVLSALQAARKARHTELEVRPAAQTDWNESIQRGLGHTVWTTGGCRSWYLDENGRNTTLWPSFAYRFRRALRRFDPAAYEARGPRPPAPAGSPLSAGVPAGSDQPAGAVS